MLDPGKQAELDQAQKYLTDNIPSLIRGMYEGFKREGFSEDRAYDLCKIYLANFTSSVSKESNDDD